MSKKTVETRNNATTKEVTSLDVIKNADSNAMLSWILGDKELQEARECKELERVQYEDKEKVVNPMLRDFYKQSYNKLNAVSDNTLLAKRKLIVAIMDSDDFKASFVNDKDFAEVIGETKTFISKAKSCVRALNWLRENGYGDDWNTSQLDEFSPTLSAQLKLDKASAFNTMLHALFDNGVFNSALSARKMRELMQNYTNEYNKIVTPKNENESTENESTESTESTENESTESTENENTSKNLKVDEIELSVKFDNGQTVTISGAYSNGQADEVYHILANVLKSNKKISKIFSELIKQN